MYNAFCNIGHTRHRPKINIHRVNKKKLNKTKTKQIKTKHKKTNKQTQRKINTTQRWKLKKINNTDPQKTGANAYAGEG